MNFCCREEKNKESDHAGEHKDKPQNPVRRVSDWNNRINYNNYNNINMSSIYGLEPKTFWFFTKPPLHDAPPTELPSRFNESTNPKWRVIIVDLKIKTDVL